MSQSGSLESEGGSSFVFLPAVYASSTANLTATYANGAAGVGATLTNAGALVAFSTDGVTPPSSSRILVQFQTAQLQNGIYVLTVAGNGATPWVMTRATDYDQPSEINPGDLVPVTNGTLYGNTVSLETAVVGAVGIDPIVFQEFVTPLITFPLSATLGGTGVASPTAHAVAVAEGASNFNFVGPSAVTGSILQSGGAASDPLFSTASYPATTTVSQLLYSSSNNVVAGLSTANNGVLITGAGGIPSISSTLPSAVQGNITSLGTISSGVWHGTSVAPTYGGTGLSNPTAHSLLVAEGASNFTALGVATNGQLPIGSTGADPVLANITSNDATVNISNGSGTIDLSVPASAGLSLAAFGSTPNANAATLSGGVLNLQPASGSFPGGVSTSAQTFAGVKTFSSAPNFSSLTASTGLVLDGSKNVSTIGIATSASAATLAERDGNANLFANNFNSNYATVASAAGVTTLSAASARIQFLTGTLAQTYRMPDATTLALGWVFEFYNNSSGVLTVTDGAAVIIYTIPAGGYARLVATNIGSAQGVWNARFDMPSNAAYGTAGMVITGQLAVSGLTGVLTGNGASNITANTVTQHGTLIGGASNAVSSLGVATNGQIVIGSTGADPVVANITSTDASVTVSNGAGTINLAVPPGGGLSLAAFGSTPNANGLSLAAGVLNMQPADATHPGGVSILAQSFAGVKTFASSPILPLTGLLTGNGASAVTASTVTQFDVLVGGASSSVSSVGPGSAGQVLQSGGAASNPVYSTATYPATTTSNQILYSSATNTVAGLSSASNSVVVTDGSSVPSLSSTLPTAVQGNITSVGTIASGTWHGTSIAPTYGGTGLSNPTAHSILVAEGASNFVALGVATNGQLIIGSTGADPVLASLNSSDSSVTITPGAGSINLQVAAGGGLSLSAFGSTPNANGLSLVAGVLNMQPADATNGGGVSTTTQTFSGVKTLSSAPILSTLTGVLTGNGASAVTANAVTQHGVLIAAASNAVSSLAVASTGTVLAGSTGADPAFTATPSVTSITISNAPVAATDGTNKSYVDAIAAGLDFKNSCYASSTTNLNATYLNGAAGIGATLTNAGSLVAFAIDGVSPPINSRILVKNQSSSFQNGIYTLATVGSGAVAWILVRSLDYDQPSEIAAGDLVPVEFGTVNATTVWLETATVTTIGTDAITFTQFISQAVSYPLSPTLGGTGLATLTAHGLVVGEGTSNVAFVGPSATTGQILQSQGSSADPAFSTATYPATTTINQVLYSSSANVVGGITAVIDGVLISNHASGVPSWLANGTAGFILTAQSGAPPAWAAAPPSGLTWSDKSTTFSVASFNGYFVTGSATATLPASPSQGDPVSFISDAGSITLTVTGNTGQTIRIGSAVSASAGTAVSTIRGDAVTLIYRASDTSWIAQSSVGTWSVT